MKIIIKKLKKKNIYNENYLKLESSDNIISKLNIPSVNNSIFFNNNSNDLSDFLDDKSLDLSFLENMKDMSFNNIDYLSQSFDYFEVVFNANKTTDNLCKKKRGRKSDKIFNIQKDKKFKKKIIDGININVEKKDKSYDIGKIHEINQESEFFQNSQISLLNKTNTGLKNYKKKNHSFNIFSIQNLSNSLNEINKKSNKLKKNNELIIRKRAIVMEKIKGYMKKLPDIEKSLYREFWDFCLR